MKKTLFLFIAFLLSVSVARLYALHAEVTLLSGEKLYGDITQETDDEYLMILDTTSEKVEIRKTDIKSLSSMNFTPRSQYVVLGCAVGTPGGLMPVIGYHHKSIGIHLSGGGTESMYGFQGEVVCNIIDKPTVSHGIALAFGNSYIEKETAVFSFTPNKKATETTTYTWSYGGIAYVFNAKLFYFELGITFGKGVYQNPQVMFQIGILHRFNRKRIESSFTPITRVESFQQ